MTSPRVSIIAGSRNDEHGGNPRRRTELFIHTLAAFAKRTGAPLELVLVEWNTPPDRGPLAEALTWPDDPGPLAIRVITVPPEIHARVGNADRVPFFQMIAKNVGIRRAAGEFVLATNIDLLLNEPLVWCLGHGPLDPDCVYRIDRLDLVLRDLPDGLDVEEQLALASLTVGRVAEARGTIEYDRAALRRRYGHVAARFPGFAPGELGRLLADAERKKPHFEACGDFTMMAREEWERLRGYPELPLYSMHQDSIGLKMALVSGLRQVVLPEPMRAYHIEHGMGWGVAEDRSRLLTSFPMLSDADLARWFAKLEAAGTALTPNGPDWGFAGETFAEWRLQPKRVAA
jgi:hypothetical protein